MKRSGVKYTYICNMPIAADVLRTGIAYIMKRSSLCGRNEYRKTNKSVETNRPMKFFDLLVIPNGTKGRNNSKHLGIAE